MSSVAFPATERDHFPSQLHDYLVWADDGSYIFPQPHQMVAPPLEEFSAKQEREVKFAYFNYWLAALRVYFINAAWARAFATYSEPGETYVAACRVINARYNEAERELYWHYGYDHQGASAR